MKTLILILVLLLFSFKVCAGTFNPCEYVNLNADRMYKLDTGDDDNFRRIVQQKNQDLVRACLDYETKLLDTRRSDLNRDNY